MKRMEQIASPPNTASQVVNVAAYARISAETERSPLSLSAQVSYYQKFICATPGWRFAGVFADSGISGTTTNRPQFQELLALARAGKIDLILTKSISRFARNTVDLLQTVRELKDKGVEVRFEKENISSTSADGELMLTLLASFAQAESEQISQNVKWRVAKQFEQGLSNGFHHYGYTDSADGTDVQVIEEEAEVVRRIYRLYLEEVSCERMAEIFKAEGIVGRSGEPIGPEAMRAWLKAELFTGTLTLGRHYSPGLGQHSRLNKGEKPMYRVTDTIPKIISRELFEQVQHERERLRQLGAHANWSIPTTCFTSTVICGHCGRSYSRSGKRSTNGEISYTWLCRTKRDGKKRSGGRTCTSKNIPETVLEDYLASVLGLEAFNSDVYVKRVEKVIMHPNQSMEVIYREGSSETIEWRSSRRQESWTPERRAAWSQRQKKLWADLEYRERILSQRASKPREPRVVGEATKAAMSAAWTPERRKALSERNKSIWASRTDQAKQAIAQRIQNSMTEQTRQSKSEKLKTAWTPERRAKASALMKQMRAAQKALKEAQQ